MNHSLDNMKYTEFNKYYIICWNNERFKFVIFSKKYDHNNGRYRYGFDTYNTYVAI